MLVSCYSAYCRLCSNGVLKLAYNVSWYSAYCRLCSNGVLKLAYNVSTVLTVTIGVKNPDQATSRQVVQSHCIL